MIGSCYFNPTQFTVTSCSIPGKISTEAPGLPFLDHCRGKEDAVPFQLQGLVRSEAQALMFEGKSAWVKGISAKVESEKWVLKMEGSIRCDQRGKGDVPPIC